MSTALARGAGEATARVDSVAMGTDPTMRIVWHMGRPYGISNMPFGPSEPATEWHILMPSGWLPLFRYRAGDEWSTVERRVLDWLAAGTI